MRGRRTRRPRRRRPSELPPIGASSPSPPDERSIRRVVPTEQIQSQGRTIVMSMQASSQSASPAADTGTAAYRGGGDSGAGTAGLTQFISFAIGDDQYGVDIMAVREIKGWSEITHLPKQPDYMRGVLNLRGAMVPIIDLRFRFGTGRPAATPLHVVIVVHTGARQVGL